MAIDVKAEVQIARTREDVAAYVVNPENDPLWIGGIKSTRMLTEPPVGVGTRVARVASFMGKRIEYTPEVMAYEAISLLTMRTNKPFEMESVAKGLGRGGALLFFAFASQYAPDAPPGFFVATQNDVYCLCHPVRLFRLYIFGFSDS